MNWKEYFEYVPETGDLVWAVRPPYHFNRPGWANTFNKKCAGKRATKLGSIYKMVGFSVGAKIHTRYAHRVIWEMHHGVIPKGLEVDHINGDKQDNRIENMRLCNRSQNGSNRAKGNRAGTNIRGVIKNGSGWLSHIWDASLGRTKSLGTFKSKGVAAVVHAKEHLKVHGKFSVFYRKQAAINHPTPF